MSDRAAVRAHTVRLELDDEPGELLNALGPIAEHGGNLLSIFHERGNRTPRGRIPVEVDVEATPERFDRIVDALRHTGVNVVAAGTERYSEELTVVLVGQLLDRDVSDTLSRIETESDTAVEEVSMTVADEDDAASSARLRIATDPDRTERVLAVLDDIAEEKGLTVISPLTGDDSG